MLASLKDIFRRYAVFERRYLPLIPPIHKAPICFTDAETEEYWNWYMENLDARCEYLRSLIAEDAGIGLEALDYSLDSLLPVWAWFLSRAKVIRKKLPRPYERYVEISRETGGKPVKRVVKYDDSFDVKTEMMICDIGMYVGKMFIQSYPGKIRWALVNKPRNYIHVNEPLLKGFVQTHRLADGEKLDSPFYPDFEPIHMVGVQAAGIFEGKANEDDLYRICRLWAGWIPG